MKSTLSKTRLIISYAFVVLLFALVVYQLVQLTVFRRDSLVHLANKQHLMRIENAPLRGLILDRTGKELATNLKIASVYAAPRMLTEEQKDALIPKVMKALDLSVEYTRGRLARNKAFIWLKRHVLSKEAEQVENLKSRALGLVYETKRFYPQGDLLSHILGFVNVDNQGLEGMELHANHDLKGRAGQRLTKRDALGREIKAFELKEIPTIDGNQVYLTIDQYIQYLTERALEKAYTQWKAKAGWAVVLNPHTGEILAIANRPTFDPNHVQLSQTADRRNRAVTDMYEPGSVFKIVAASAVLNENAATLQTTFDCEKGEYRYMRGRVLHDVHPYGDLSLEEIIVKSSNIGTVKATALLDPDVFQRYIQSFGFGSLTGVDLPGEVAGFTRPPSRWSKTSPFNIPIGHEILVTSLQLANMMAVIANGGNRVQPYIISRVEDSAGVVVKKKEPRIVERVISEDVALQMRRVLKRVVDEGTGKRAQIAGIPVGGKTGTAQKVLENGKGYSHEDFMSSFVGFAPVENPMLVMVVTLDDPGPKYYGGTVAAPVFKEVMEPALISMGYVPEESQPAA